MRVISVVSSKGGVGKTTISSALAVRAAQESRRVAIVDLDPMGSLAAWWKRRGGSQNPCIFTGADTASDAVEALELDGWDWVFIDTPPAFLNTISDAIDNADLAVIPLRASALDLIASEDAVLMARDIAKRQRAEGMQPVGHLCVLNDAEPRWKTTDTAREYLLKGGVPVAETVIAHRQAYLAAMTSGKTGPEVDRVRDGDESPSAREINRLFAEVKALTKKPRKRGRL
jgi:chromosome partitioning protein